MSAEKSHRVLWFTRREGVVRGPYPRKQISRYVLLGRIRTTDEVRSEGGGWRELTACPELIPEVMKLPPTEENRQRLLMARLREDERQPRDRRERNPNPPRDILEQRSGRERRRPESEAVLRHRALRDQVLHGRRSNSKLYRYPLVASVIVILGFLLSYTQQQFEAETLEADCAAVPQPGVKWGNCNLIGLIANQVNLVGADISNARMDNAQLSGARLDHVNLEYTSLNLSNLRRADLSNARLVGVTLRGSDLRDSKLVMADLSYANLSEANIEGADFTGAILDNTIWIDQKLCSPGSIGVCKRSGGKGSVLGQADTSGLTEGVNLEGR
jgi:uncharacterized protein YjbI with pentapeptide repeats